jgi:phosphatidate cytidylyltransferase
MSMDLRKRLVSSAIALPVALYMLQYITTKLLFLCLATIQLKKELLNLLSRIEPTNPSILDLLLSLVTPLGSYWWGPSAMSMLFVATAGIESLRAMIAWTPSGASLRRVLAVMFGHVYVDVMLAHAVALHETFCSSQTQGTLIVLFVMCSTIAGDNGGLFLGYMFGKRRLAPALSPSKSIEGALGGMLLSTGCAMLFWVVGWKGLSTWRLTSGCGVMIGIVGCLGDLFESWIKRCCGVKDAGNLFPGWGGLLDRADSLLFTFPSTLYFVTMFLSENNRQLCLP